jgi:predicted Zn finger-like uncharacterized protein
MALATQCPHCKTSFRVAQDQLKLRGGIVRCGACHEIFDANASLVDLDGAAAAQAQPAPPVQEEQPAAGQPGSLHTAAEGALPEVEQAPGDTNPLASRPGRRKNLSPPMQPRPGRLRKRRPRLSSTQAKMLHWPSKLSSMRMKMRHRPPKLSNMPTKRRHKPPQLPNQGPRNRP